MYVCVFSFRLFLQALVDRNASINIFDEDRLTPLHESVHAGDAELTQVESLCMLIHSTDPPMQVLLDHGALPDVFDITATAPLHVATLFGREDIAKVNGHLRHRLARRGRVFADSFGKRRVRQCRRCAWMDATLSVGTRRQPFCRRGERQIPS